MKIHPILFILLSACAATPPAHKGGHSIANIVFNYHGAGNIVSDCRNSTVGYHKTAEIVCFETSPIVNGKHKTFQDLEQKLRDAGWITPDPYMVSNARKRVPASVLDEDFFVLKLEGSDNCTWSSVTVFIDKVFTDKEDLLRMKVSLNKLHDACEVLI